MISDAVMKFVASIVKKPIRENLADNARSKKGHPPAISSFFCGPTIAHENQLKP